MTVWRLIVGPPGTGKTTALLEILKEELACGVLPGRIAFLSFTRAARLEAITRVGHELGLNEDDLPWCRTVHSASYRLLHVRPEALMLDERWQEFAALYGDELTTVYARDDVLEPPRRTPADTLRWVLSWGRCRRLSLERTHGTSPIQVDGRLLRQFAQRYDRFRAERDLLDFSEMVERVVQKKLAPSIDVALVDEAQDLSPLEIAAIEIWTRGCQRVYVAGDPDQAVYSFKGATPDWMMSLEKTAASTTYLEESHRVPASAHRISARIISSNLHRLASSYRPARREGEVDVALGLDEALDHIEPTGAFVLSRNRFFLRAASWHLFRAGRPYVVEGGGAGPNPLGSSDMVRAVRTAYALHKGTVRIDQADVVALLGLVPVQSGLVDRGAKARVEEKRGMLDVPAVAAEVGFSQLLVEIAKHPMKPLTRLDVRYRDYFWGLFQKHGEIPAPKIRLMTIHASKGREHDHVVLLPDHTGQVDHDYRSGDWESENRIRYVAVTRTRQRLTLVRPQSRKYFQYPTERRTS